MNILKTWTVKLFKFLKRKQIVFSSIIILIFFILKIIKFENEIIDWLLYIIFCFPIILKIINKFKIKLFFDEYVLLFLASLSAMVLKHYDEAFLVVYLFLIGSFLQNKAIKRSRSEIQKLFKFQDKKILVKENGVFYLKPAQELKIKDKILLKKGEQLPVDCLLKSPEALFDTSAINGESLPHYAKENEICFSGYYNKSDDIYLEVYKEYNNSLMTKMIEIIEDSNDKKTNIENNLNSITKKYTPTVIVLAFLLAFIPPIFGGDFKTYLLRACSFLVISCPCALVISIPLTFFASIGKASSMGILIKGSNFFEIINNVKVIMTDKTATLTTGDFIIKEIETYDNISKEEILKIAGKLEGFSNHPLAKAIFKESGISINQCYEAKDYKGLGRQYKDYLIGNYKIFNDLGFNLPNDNLSIYIFKNKKPLGKIILMEEIKREVKSVFEKLKNKNIKQIILATGDSNKQSKELYKNLKIDKYYSDLKPEDKYKILKELQEKSKVAYIGDGINDIACLKQSDVSIGMGKLGQDLALEFSDCVIVDDNLNKINDLFKISKKTLKLVKQNIYFVMTIKILILFLSSLGYGNMLMAIFGDVGVSLIAILNGLRIIKKI